MPSPGEVSTDKLADLLLDFGQAPGNYPVRLGEPRELYAQLDTVAAWALGRVPPDQASRTEALREAAVLFVQRACFPADATHYQVLGLSAKSLTPETLRARYRALIRLTHPDMGVQGLPASAAGIVNRAHEVLGDPEARRRYDEQLAQRTATAPAASVDVQAAVRRIDLHQGWGERWQSLLARYPNIGRVGLTVCGVGALGIGLLIWAAGGSQEGRTLIVARGTDSGLSAQPRKATRQGPDDESARSGSMPQRSAATNAGSSTLSVQAKAEPAQEAPRALQWRDAWQIPSLKGAPSNAPGQAETVRQREPLRAPSPAEAPPPAAPPAQVARAPAPAPLAAAPAQPPSPSPAPPVQAERAQSNNIFAAAPAAPSPAPRPQPAPPPAPAPVEREATVAQPAPQRPAPGSTFNVDTNGAKLYLTDVISALERPAKARTTNAYLRDMRVQGSLLQPALQLMRRYPEMNVDQMTWTDTQRAGVMSVQGVVVLTVRSLNNDEVRKVSFHLQAEFWGTREGTVLASLNMKEGD